MSLVGTRPILQDELQKYELHHRARIAIKPGITGMWQVSGRSDMATVVRSFAIQGIDGYPVDIEVKMLEGQPVISIIGLGDQAVKEAAERIKDWLLEGFD